MDNFTLGILITSIISGALAGIKKTKEEIKSLKESSIDVNKKIEELQDTPWL